MPDTAPDPVLDPASAPMTDIMVVNSEADHRYEAWLGEALAGFTQGPAAVPVRQRLHPAAR